jgi:hypothetical protein
MATIQTSTLNRVVGQMQLEQNENSQDVRERIRVERAGQRYHKTEALKGNKEAGELRGDAADTASAYQAVAAALTAAAAIAACCGPYGAIIAAILLVIAAVFALLAHLEREGKEQEAAQLEEEAGVQEIMAEQNETRIDELKETDDDRQAYVDQIMEKLAELKQQQAQGIKL